MSTPSPQPQDDDSVTNKRVRPSDEGVNEGNDDDDNNGAQPQSEEDALMDEEHLVWRKNAPFLYVVVVGHAARLH